jgi:peptidoglycan hydrolase CwlO-like protein
MKTIRFLCLFLILISGCAKFSPFSPTNRQRINNQGNIEDIRSNQSGIMAEIGKLKQDAQILDSQLKEIQSGLVNISAAISKNENNGIQILQGDGALIFVFSIITLGMVIFYRSRAVQSEQNLKILAKEITKINDPRINDQILKIAIEKGTESSMLKTLKKSCD